VRGVSRGIGTPVTSSVNSMVYISMKNKWTDHIEYVCNKLQKFIGVFLQA